MDANPILVEQTRGDHVENRHRGALVVVDAAGSIVIERASDLTSSGPWTSVQTNQVAAGPFTVSIASVPGASAFFRVRKP